MEQPPTNDYPSFGSADTQPLPRPPGRRKFLKWGFLATAATAIALQEGIGLWAAIKIAKNIRDQLAQQSEFVPTEERARGKLIGAFDQKGKSIKYVDVNGKSYGEVPGNKLILIFSETPGYQDTISQVECTGNFHNAYQDNRDNQGGWPVIGRLKKPNYKGKFYQFSANMNNLNNLDPTKTDKINTIPVGQSFQISVNVSGTWTKSPPYYGNAFRVLGEPGPIGFIRV